MSFCILVFCISDKGKIKEKTDEDVKDSWKDLQEIYNETNLNGKINESRSKQIKPNS